MQSYLDLLADIKDNGSKRTDRTGTGTYALFGRQLKFDLAAGFPLLTTKRVHFKSIKHELLWFLQGSTNVAQLHEHNVSIWDEWADENGDLGPIYGSQWRSWSDGSSKSYDQIKTLVQALDEDPCSRRLIVSAWNVGALDQMRLAPCHIMFQAWANDGKLSLKVYQRSADVFLGLPFNIASYALLTHMLARQAGLQAGELIMTLGDSHLYVNHVNQACEQLKRSPRALPQLELSGESSIFSYEHDQITVHDYNPHPPIKAPVAV